MLNKIEDVHNLTTNLIKKKELLDKVKLNNEKIKVLINQNNELHKEINTIINKYLVGINILLKLCCILLIIISVVGVSILSNYNFIVMLLFSVISPVTCIFMKFYITELFKKRYKKKNKKIIYLETLINENNIKINEVKRLLIKLTDCIMKISDYKENNNSRKEYCYIYSQKNYNIDINSGLKKIRKINNKTRK